VEREHPPGERPHLVPAEKFTPRRTTGTTSARNLAIGDRLEAEGRMSPAGRAALGR
jgi:hypothetical protein